MPIQFECTRCRKQVRVPDGTHGKKTRCPHCQAVIEIPYSAAVPGSAELGSAGPGGQSEASPRPGRFSPPPTFGQGERENAASPDPGPLPYERASDNPYAPPSEAASTGAFAERRYAEARQKLVIPSVIALMFVILSLMLLLLVGFVGIVELFEDPTEETIPGLIVVGVVVGLHLLTAAGIFSATFRWNYALAWVGFIGALLPCSNLCAGGLLTMGVAIWGMVVLTDPAVRRQFRS